VTPDSTIWLKINPADIEKIRQEMAAQPAALQHHEKQFTAMEVALQETSARHNQHLKTEQSASAAHAAQKNASGFITH